MPSSTRSNKETQLLFSPDPASLECSIHKEARSSSIDNTTCSSIHFCQPPSNQTLVSSTDTRSPLSTEDTHLPSTDIFHPTSIDTSIRTSIDNEPRDMIATLILVRYDRGNLHDQDGHLRNAAVVKEEKLQEGDFKVESLMSFAGSHWCRSTPSHEHRSTEVIQNQSTSSPGHRSTTPTESTASCKAVRIMTHEEFAAKHPHPPSHVYVNIDRHSDPTIDRQQKTVIDRQPQAPIDRRAPIMYQVQMPKIDVARLNAHRPKPKPSKNIPETVRTPLDDGVDPMDVDRVPKGRTLRKRKEKWIPQDKPFDEAYYTHRLWMFFRETRETEEDIRRMLCEAREKMRMKITLKNKSDPGQFAIPCTVKGIEFPHALCDTGASRNSGGIVRDLEVQIGNALVPVDFHVLDIKLNWNSSLLLGRAFLSTVGAVCNLQTNQLCLTLINPNAHYDPIPVKNPQTTSRRINDPRIIAACHCGAEYEIEYSASIKTHTATSIDNAHQKSTDTPKKESVDSSQGEWENDYYIPTMATHTMHTEEYDEDYEYSSTLIDTQPHQPNHLRASTDNTYFPSIDTNVDATRDRDYSIGSWADICYQESYAVETAYRDQGDDELNEGFTYKEFLNMQRRDETDQNRAATAWERTRFSHPIDRESRPSLDTNQSQSIDINNTTSIDIRPKPKTTVSEKDKSDNQYLTPYEFGIFRDPDGYARAIHGRTLHVSREDIADIIQTANGADNLFIHQRNILEHQQKESYDTASGIDKSFKQRTRHPTQPSIDVDVPTSVDRRPKFGRRAFDLLGTRRFYWEEKDEYGIYRVDQGYARDLDGHTIRVHNRDFRRLLERASRDEPSCICLPEHASSFTQTKLVPEIYTKDEINEMFYGVCGEHEKNKEAFQMKFDGVYYPLNDSISWLTNCMEEMKQDIARIQSATDVA
ncbi:hypothetical protein DY000_02040832 [Brassica cretica]|uniref:Aspartic peptidase DDI1-type domain-containing protein n=1 Tax=Brassica cretica TaxID=69181 RepID=A0ABQ7BEA8_BRACR|nr:hypothetical protein DY000_02040832 [Brassica cretica]